MQGLENKKKSLKFNNLYFFVMFFMILSFSAYLVYKYDSLVTYNQKVETLNKQLEEANKINEDLKSQTEYKNSNEYIEKIARDKLGMVKSNEIIFYDNKN